MADKGKAKSPQGKKAAEEVLNGFNALRAEQRRVTQKISELESDRTEHNLVLNTLRETDPSRRCYRLVGGILVERTVGQVLPALEANVDKIEKVIEALNKQAVQKGQELVEYREKYNIRLAGLPQKDESKPAGSDVPGELKSAAESAGVLVDAAAAK